MRSSITHPPGERGIPGIGTRTSVTQATTRRTRSRTSELTLGDVVGIFESVCGRFEGREAGERDHLAELCEVIYGILDGLGPGADVLLEVDLEYRISRRRLE